jgi:hypothetical protein
MHRCPVLLVLVLATAACSGDGESRAPNLAPPDPRLPETADALAPPVRGRFENLTEEEKKARWDEESQGTLVLDVLDEETGAPVTDWWYYGVKYSLEESGVDAKIHTEVDFFGERPEAPDGHRRIALSAGWYRLRLEADGYRDTWTRRFRIDKGEDTAFSMTLLEANRLRVKVFDENGEPLEDGALLVEGENRKGAFSIHDGVGEDLMYDDEVVLHVGRVFLEDYAPQTIKVKLERGRVNEVTVHLKRP